MLEFDYDSLVYDTYDYIDKVVELSLKGPFTTAFKVYYDLTQDVRAKKMISYLKYGTIDERTILLKKYGFFLKIQITHYNRIVCFSLVPYQ